MRSNDSTGEQARFSRADVQPVAGVEHAPSPRALQLGLDARLQRHELPIADQCPLSRDGRDRLVGQEVGAVVQRPQPLFGANQDSHEVSVPG
jgi:hypothetical protein